VDEQQLGIEKKREYNRAYQRLYRAKHRERIKQYQKQYQKEYWLRKALSCPSIDTLERELEQLKKAY
jgi:hypothetical protein